MSSVSPSPIVRSLATFATSYPGLRMLVLHGSRARGDFHDASDWDFAYLGEENLDPLDLQDGLSSLIHTDKVDLADLARAGGLLRFRVATDGIVIFEREPGLFENFCCDAASFWLDVADIVRVEHDAILKALG